MILVMGGGSGGREGVGLLTVVGGIEPELGISKLSISLVSTSSATAAPRRQLGIPTKCESHPLLSWQPPKVLERVASFLCLLLFLPVRQLALA